MSMFAKVKDWFSIQDEGEEEFYAADEVGAKRNVVPLSDASRRSNVGGSVAVFAPRSFADVTEIADALRSRQVVIVNVQGDEPLIDPNLHSCGTVSPHGVTELTHPETNFFIAGMKSYGRAPTFLLLTGYEQVRSIADELAGDHAAARSRYRVAARRPESNLTRISPSVCIQN